MDGRSKNIIHSLSELQCSVKHDFRAYDLRQQKIREYNLNHSQSGLTKQTYVSRHNEESLLSIHRMKQSQTKNIRRVSISLDEARYNANATSDFPNYIYTPPEKSYPNICSTCFLYVGNRFVEPLPPPWQEHQLQQKKNQKAIDTKNRRGGSKDLISYFHNPETNQVLFELPPGCGGGSKLVYSRNQTLGLRICSCLMSKTRRSRILKKFRTFASEQLQLRASERKEEMKNVLEKRELTEIDMSDIV